MHWQGGGAVVAGTVVSATGGTVVSSKNLKYHQFLFDAFVA